MNSDVTDIWMNGCRTEAAATFEHADRFGRLDTGSQERFARYLLQLYSSAAKASEHPTLVVELSAGRSAQGHPWSVLQRGGRKHRLNPGSALNRLVATFDFDMPPTPSVLFGRRPNGSTEDVRLGGR